MMMGPSAANQAVLVLGATFLPWVEGFAFQTPQLELPTLPNLFNPLSPTTRTFSYTHLECNGQLWQATSGNNEVSVVIDPLASQLDFGIPWGYRANKQSLSEDATIDLICDANPSHCLLTMGLDDHTHLPTLAKVRERLPNLQYIVAPSCLAKLLEFGLESDRITVLEHGEACNLSDGASVQATEGALVGPPWQRRENGFLLKLDDGNGNENDLAIYYEPHGDVVMTNIAGLKADVMVSPVTKQSLPAQVPVEGQFTLVYGGDRTLEISESLGAEVIIPLGNGALDIDGPLAGLVAAEGNVGDFERLVSQRNEGRQSRIRVEKASPGVPLKVAL